MNEPSSEEVSPWPVDARGRPCPIPIAMLARALQQHPLVELRADDPAVEGDLQAFCLQAGAGLRSLRRDGPQVTAVVSRAP